MKKYLEDISDNIFGLMLALVFFIVIGLNTLESIRIANYDLASIEITKVQIDAYQLIEDCAGNYEGFYSYEKIRDVCSEDYFDKDFEELQFYFDKKLRKLAEK